MAAQLYYATSFTTRNREDGWQFLPVTPPWFMIDPFPFLPEVTGNSCGITRAHHDIPFYCILYITFQACSEARDYQGPVGDFF